MQDGRHTMRESDFFFLDERAKHVRRIAARIDLLDAHDRRYIRYAPCMHVEHRRDRHVHIRVVKSLLFGRHTQRSQAGQRVQHHLPMAEADAFGPSCRGGRVKCRGPRILVEVGEFVTGRTGVQQLFILGGETERRLHSFTAVSEQHKLLHGLYAIFNRSKNW